MRLLSALALAIVGHPVSSLGRSLVSDLLNLKDKKGEGDLDQYVTLAHHDVQELFLAQQLNHFDEANGLTFQQRYFRTTRYIQLATYRSTKYMTITRTIGKIDTVLSYVGGLFSLLFTAIAFMFGSYSTYKYELYVAESTLTNNKGKSFKS